MIRRRRKLSCRQVGRSLQQLLDHEIDDPERVARLQEHLDACRDCGLEAEAYRSLSDAIQRTGADASSPELQRLREFGARLAAGEIDPD
ncbi:MAG: zf-HC2 domain-containing protein [Acidimicrobiales bacterium]